MNDQSSNQNKFSNVLLFENVTSTDCTEKDYFERTSRVSENESTDVNSDGTVGQSSELQGNIRSDVYNKFTEYDIEHCNSTLNFNKLIISYLLDLKKHITFALQKCEEKLTVVEASLQKHAIGDAKILICNAGMPYFKDRNYFFPPNNRDETLKEEHRELQLRNLPKVSLWTIKERNTFLQAIHAEVVANMLCSPKADCMESNDLPYTLKLETEKEKVMQQTVLPNDFSEMVGPLGQKNFDWLKISSAHFDEKHSPLDCRVMWNVFLHPDINKNSWKRSENIKLKEIVAKHEFQNWDKIARELGTNRTAYQCFIRYNTTRKLPKAKNCVWKTQEDNRLLKLVEAFRIDDFIPWGEVASWMQNRTKQQAYFRWTYSLAPSLRKGRFSQIEDSLLKDAVVKYGTNFCKISAALMPNRSTAQLHDRYQTLTANKIHHWKKWTLIEDSKLFELFQRFGTNWSEIAKAFSCKTRTQVRHRYATLQKCINRGVSIVDLHKDVFNNQHTEEQKQKKEISHENEIDQELIEYFHRKRTIENSAYKSRLCTREQLTCHTKRLYDTLRSLNAKLCIPDDIGNTQLSDRNKQLLRSLKEYIQMRNDKERCFKLVSACTSYMFGMNHTMEEDSPFMALPPTSGSQSNFSESNNTEFIDCTLNTNQTFLHERPSQFNTPDFVVSYIGGSEQELQFQKFAQSLHSNCIKSKMQHDTQHVNINNQNNLNGNVTKITDSSIGTEQIEEKAQNFSSMCERTPIGGQPLSMIEPTHATLLSFQHLMYLKLLKDKYGCPDQICIKSKKFQEAFGLFEMRLEQLFKYPIGLSRTVLPKIYAMDTFSNNDSTSNKKARRVSETFKEYDMKRLQSHSKSGKHQR